MRIYHDSQVFVSEGFLRTFPEDLGRLLQKLSSIIHLTALNWSFLWYVIAFKRELDTFSFFLTD